MINATRDVLRRSLTHVVLRRGSRCVVESGILDDPYSGRLIHFRRGPDTSARVQIDHVAPLALIYDLGAQIKISGCRLRRLLHAAPDGALSA